MLHVKIEMQYLAYRLPKAACYMTIRRMLMYRLTIVITGKFLNNIKKLEEKWTWKSTVSLSLGKHIRKMVLKVTRRLKVF